MPGLTSAQTLAAWEHGRWRHPIDRALTLLWVTDPTQDYTSLAGLPLGVRNARLLELHIASFGSRLDCRATCPDCSEALEFSVNAVDLLGIEQPQPDHNTASAGSPAQTLFHVRPLTSLDLVAASRTPDPETAREELIRRCLDVGKAEAAAPLDQEARHQLAQALALADPLAEISFQLKCQVCQHAWEAPFDIAQYLWAEIHNQARRLLWEVHELALAYGWSEAEILALNPQRRQSYLEMLPAANPRRTNNG